MSGRWRVIRSGLPRLLWFTNQMMLISIWNHEHVYVYQFGLGRFNSYIQGSCLGCVTDTLDLTEPFLFQGGTLVGVCVIGAHVVPRTLGALGSLRERHGQTLLVLQPAVHPDLLLFFSEYTGFGRFPPADPDVRELGGGRGVWRRLHEPVHLAVGQALHRRLLRLGAPGVRREHRLSLWTLTPRRPRTIIGRRASCFSTFAVSQCY